MRTMSKKTTITDLPNQVLKRILEYLPQRNRDKLFVCSKRFKHLVEIYCGKTVFLGISSIWMKGRFPYKTNSKEGIDLIRNFGVRCCLIGKLLDHSKDKIGFCQFIYKIRNYLWGKNELIEFKYPQLLQKLKFEGRISSNYFESLTTGIFNLKILFLHWKTISSLSQSVLEPLYFPNLITLDIYGGHDVKLHAKIPYAKLCNFVENLSVLLKNVFLSLRVFRLDLPNHMRFLMLLTYGLLVFLERHCKTLMIFKLELISIPFIDLPKTAECQVSFRHTSVLFSKMQEVALKMNLMSMILISFSNNTGPYLDNWIYFIEKQCCLKEFQGTGIYFNDKIAQNIISNNLSSLTVLNLCLRIRELGLWIPFDCLHLSQCVRLQELTLEGMEILRHGGQSSGIINVNLLPQTLKTLAIKEIPLSTETINYICLELHSLKQLRLISVGIGLNKESGVTSQVIRSIVKRKQLIIFAFSWDSMIHEEDYTNFALSSFTGTGSHGPIEYFSESTIEIRLVDDSYKLVDGWLPLNVVI